MKNEFKKYLVSKGYKEYTENGNPSTAYNYCKRIDNVCLWEKIDWEDLASRIKEILPEYQSSGGKAHLGAKYNNNVRNALTLFSKFVKDRNRQNADRNNETHTLGGSSDVEEKEVFFIGGHTTGTLEMRLHCYVTYDQFEAEFSDEFLNSDCRLGTYLNKLLFKHNISATRASLDADLSANYINEIITKGMHPTRNKLLRIAIVIEASVEETQHLLRYAGYDPLYVRRKRDVIVWFGLSKGEDLDTIDQNITTRGLQSLYTEE